jgi:diguanylate cyclase (GGDEF)-like protein
MNARILVVDDDPDIVQFVRVNLELEGFDVDTASDGHQAMRATLTGAPDVVVLDVMMPGMDGLNVLKQLRSHPAAANTSIILLTAKALPEDRVTGLDLGADDYITKPFDINELVARVKAVLRRTKALRDVSPLTGLPGNFRIASELEARIESGDDFALVYADLDNFKAYNDHYGFMRGDQVIKFTVHALLEAAAALEDQTAFVGHIGGDDFVAIILPDQSEEFCRQAISVFDDGVLDYYETADALRGYIEVTDRRGERHAFPIVSVSLGVATNTTREITSQWQASAIAVEMKEHAKRVSGSSYEIDRRMG